MKSTIQERAEAAELIRQGVSGAEVGRRFGRCRTWALDCLHKEEAKRKHQTRWYGGLSVRAVNVLKRAGYGSRKAVVDDFKHGRLEVKYHRWCGKITYAEIIRWIGATP